MGSFYELHVEREIADLEDFGRWCEENRVPPGADEAFDMWLDSLYEGGSGVVFEDDLSEDWAA